MEKSTEDNQLIFDMLNPVLQKNWLKSGFDSPTPIQEKAIPLIIEGKDLICESPTGTGKTLAYLLPLIQQINKEQKATQAIIVAPSRELVMQIYDEVQKWIEKSGITTASFIGGANIKRQVEKLKKHPQIVVGTPGRINELIKMKKLKMHHVQLVVVDEADQLITAEHELTVRNIINSALKERQVLFFSATISDTVEQKGKEILDAPMVIKINRNEEKSRVEHSFIVCEKRDKIDVLRRLVQMGQMKGLAFINDLGMIAEVGEKLKYKHIPLEVLDGESKKAERERAIRKFRQDLPLLLATDVAARGLDVQGITHVIHFDPPKDTAQYLHRSGRTGRMGATGQVISIVTRSEVKRLFKIGKDLGIFIKEKTLFKGKMIDKN